MFTKFYFLSQTNHAIRGARAWVACVMLAYAASGVIFLVIIMQYKVFVELGIHLPADSYS